MVEKIIINPNKVRGYGNIVSSKGVSDFITYAGSITEGTDTVYGATEKVYTVEDTFIFTDGGTTNNHNTNWTKYNAQNITVNVTDEYTAVSGSNYKYGTPITKSCKITLEVNKDAASGNILSVWYYTSDPASSSQLLVFSYTELGLTAEQWSKIEMTVTENAVLCKNLTTGTTVAKSYSTSNNLIFNFWGTSFKYRNFAAYETPAQYLFVDTGTSSSYNSGWNNSNITVSRSSTDTTLAQTSTDSSGFYELRGITPTDNVIEFDFYSSATDEVVSIRHDSTVLDWMKLSEYGLSANTWYHIKIESKGTSVTYSVDGVVKETITVSDTVNRFSFRVYSQSITVKYKNLRVYNGGL